MFFIDVALYFTILPEYLGEFSKAVGASDTLFNIIQRKSVSKDIIV